jgi:adenine-specific DNA-methyltransferase
VTVDRIPPALRDVVAQNAEQWAEWERLGFKPENTGDAGLFGGAAWGTREYLEACDKLVVDTRLFPYSFQIEVLSNMIMEATNKHVDSQTCGLLVSGDNFQSMSLLESTLRDNVAVVKIDPPYNTDTSGFIYKNAYRNGSWLSFMLDRVMCASRVLADDGVFMCHIDENEYERLRLLLDQSSLPELGTIVWDKRNPMNSTVGIANQHEYVILRSRCQVSLVTASEGPSRMLAKLRALIAQVGAVNEQVRREYVAWLDAQDDLTGGEKAYRYVDENGNAYQSVSLRAPEPRSDPKFFIPLVHPVTQQPCAVPPNGFSRTPETLAAMQMRGEILFGDDHSTQPRQKVILRTDTKRQIGSVIQDASKGKVDLDRLGLAFPYCHPVGLYRRLIESVPDTRGRWVVDYFAGSGTTGHAVVELVRAGKPLSFVLVEMGNQFADAVKPRMAKVLYCPDWKDGRPQSHDKGLSALVKYFYVESYEDALNNLPAPSGTLLDGRSDDEKKALITYGLDLELGPHLLNLDAFRDPWGYTINAQLAGDAEIKRHRVDLVETFNYLIGLKVHAYGPLERYSADFERAAHADGLGRVKITGRLRRDPNGPFVFQRVEGELNDGNATRVLVVWRKLTDDPEKDAAVLDAWMARHRETTRERTEHRDYHLIYINGPVTLPQPTAEIRTVFPTEETFKIKMFEDTDSASEMGGVNG